MPTMAIGIWFGTAGVVSLATGAVFEGVDPLVVPWPLMPDVVPLPLMLDVVPLPLTPAVVPLPLPLMLDAVPLITDVVPLPLIPDAGRKPAAVLP